MDQLTFAKPLSFRKGLVQESTMKYLTLLVFATSLWAGELPAPIRPLTRAHAHNDYEHIRPLWDALDRGFGSVEADIWLTGDLLLVAHDKKQVKPDRTLEAL